VHKWSINPLSNSKPPSVVTHTREGTRKWKELVRNIVTKSFLQFLLKRNLFSLSAHSVIWKRKYLTILGSFFVVKLLDEAVVASRNTWRRTATPDKLGYVKLIGVAASGRCLLPCFVVWFYCLFLLRFFETHTLRWRKPMHSIKKLVSPRSTNRAALNHSEIKLPDNCTMSRQIFVQDLYSGE
jgi:hypothetical protein